MSCIKTTNHTCIGALMNHALSSPLHLRLVFDTVDKGNAFYAITVITIIFVVNTFNSVKH